MSLRFTSKSCVICRWLKPESRETDWQLLDPSAFVFLSNKKQQEWLVAVTGTNARLRSKQQLLHILVERVRDQNAYTRARVLQTWMYLAEKTAIPLGHWICVTQIAVGAAPCIRAVRSLETA